jgi:hypothetical protein
LARKCLVGFTKQRYHSHASRLAGPKTKFVSVNNDTVYSIAMLDVSGGAVGLLGAAARLGTRVSARGA